MFKLLMLFTAAAVHPDLLLLRPHCHRWVRLHSHHASYSWPRGCCGQIDRLHIWISNMPFFYDLQCHLRDSVNSSLIVTYIKEEDIIWNTEKRKGGTDYKDGLGPPRVAISVVLTKSQHKYERVYSMSLSYKHLMKNSRATCFKESINYVRYESPLWPLQHRCFTFAKHILTPTLTSKI